MSFQVVNLVKAHSDVAVRIPADTGMRASGLVRLTANNTLLTESCLGVGQGEQGANRDVRREHQDVLVRYITTCGQSAGFVQPLFSNHSLRSPWIDGLHAPKHQTGD